jgi:hypothetical protein
VRKLAIVLAGLALVLAFGCAKKAEEAPAISEEYSDTGYALDEPEMATEAPPPGEEMSKKAKDDRAPTTLTRDGMGGEGATDITGDVLAGVPEANAEEIAGDLKLIKTADITCEVDDVDKGFEDVYAVAAAENGLVVGTNRAVAGEGYVYGSVTIKVHPAKYDETIRALRDIGRLVSETSTTSDVTQEYYDVQARLENAEATRDRYLQILATRAGTVPDVLEVEREIERVTENIERFKGQLRYFDSQVGLSTITVHLEEPHAAVPTGYSFGKAVKDAFRIAVRICIFLVQAVIVLMPFIILLIILILIIRFIVWRIRVRRRKAKQAAIDA